MATLDERVRTLFDDYVFYWLRCGNIKARINSGAPMRTPKLDVKKTKLFSQTIEWCDQRGIDPRLWLYTLFTTRRWLFAVMLTPGSLMSENMIERYQRKKDFDTYRAMNAERAGKAQAVWDPNRDISITVEAIKRRYLAAGDAQRCLDELAETTLGFHPKSSVCSSCPLQAQCCQAIKAAVKFDIIALRRGDISVEEAQRQAQQAGG